MAETDLGRRLETRSCPKANYPEYIAKYTTYTKNVGVDVRDHVADGREDAADGRGDVVISLLTAVMMLLGWQMAGDAALLLA